MELLKILAQKKELVPLMKKVCTVYTLWLIEEEDS